MEKASFGMPMEMFLKGSSRTISQMALGFTPVPMELDMRACGLTTYRTVKAKLSGQTLQHIQEITFKAENMVLVLTNGQKATLTAGSGKIIRLVDLAPMNGLMAEGTKDTGKTTSCMDRGSTLGWMDVNMMANILTIKKMEKVAFIGLMVENTTGFGKMADNMVKVYSRQGRELQEKGSGKMGQE